MKYYKRYRDIVRGVAKELDLESDVVEKVYKHYLRYIKDAIVSMPFPKDRILSEEEFNKVSANFIIPKLGKLGSEYKNYVLIAKNVQAKKGKATVQLVDNNDGSV